MIHGSINVVPGLTLSTGGNPATALDVRLGEALRSAWGKLAGDARAELTAAWGREARERNVGSAIVFLTQTPAPVPIDAALGVRSADVADLDDMALEHYAANVLQKLAQRLRASREASESRASVGEAAEALFAPAKIGSGGSGSVAALAAEVFHDAPPMVASGGSAVEAIAALMD